MKGLPYLPDNTRWGYMSKVAKEFNIKMGAYNTWTPKPMCTNDKILMDVACGDRYFDRCRWKLEIINNCRLYLRVFTSREMAIGEDQLDNRFYDRSKRNEANTIEFEEVEKPPATAWDKWKRFLFRNFVKEIIDYKLL